MPAFPRIFCLGSVAMLAAAFGCGGPSATSPDKPGTPVTSNTDTAINIVRGSVIGRAVYPAGDSPKGGLGSPISGVECINSTGAYHIHSHLSLFVNGEQIAIAAGIGVVPPVLLNGYADFNASSCFYWLHTHDATGVIHVNPAQAIDMTLGMLFDVWGYTLSRTEVAENLGAVVVYVDGLLYAGDPRAIVFANNKEISLQVGLPLVRPPLYRIPTNP
jgi:hypothetical protein